MAKKVSTPKEPLNHRYKLFSAIVSVVLTLILGALTYDRILNGLEAQPTLEAARMATLVATCALGVAVVRLSASMFPTNGWERMFGIIIILVIVTCAVVFLGVNLGAPMPELKFLVLSIALVLCPIFEDVMFLLGKDEKPAEDEKVLTSN